MGKSERRLLFLITMGVLLYIAFNAPAHYYQAKLNNCLQNKPNFKPAVGDNQAYEVIECIRWINGAPYE